MSARSAQMLKAVLKALYYSGAGSLVSPFTKGDGVIFMLHHVTPEKPRGFEPNGILKITPEFLETVILHVKGAGFDFVSLDEVPERLNAGTSSQPFAAFTLDDGYKDNRDFAFPIFQRHQVPFTIYVPSEFGDGNGDLWWLTLEEALRPLLSTDVIIGGEWQHYELASDAQKSVAFAAIYWQLRAQPEVEARAVVADLAARAGFDASTQCAKLVMNWDELRDFAKDPLVSVGAHTNRHFALAKLPVEKARREIVESIAKIERELGRPCRHFSYPYGCELSAGTREFQIVRELGMTTAVTTRKGLLNAGKHLDFAALPRLSLNGDFQDERYLKVLLSGLPFALWNAAAEMRRGSRSAAKAS